MKTVGNCMKHAVISITTRSTVREAIQTCVRYHIGTLPVIDSAGRLVGTLRLADMIGLGMPDFLQFIENIEFIHTFGAMELQHPDASVMNQPVTALMKDPVWVEQDAGLLRASALLYKHQLTDVPVVDDQHRLVGIASRVDIGVALLVDWTEEAGE